MKPNPDQIEFCDLRRGQKRPAGGGQLIDGFFVFNATSQRVDQVAYTLTCTRELIYKHIHEGEFPNARDISASSSAIACYRIPRTDVLEFLDIRKEGAK